MSSPLVLAPAPIAAVAGGALPTNLLTDDPREVWIGAGDAPQLMVDLGAVTTLDTIYLGYLSAGSAGTLAVVVDGQALGTIAFALPRRGGPAHALLALPAPVAARNLTLTLTPAAADRPLAAGVLMVGLSFRPGWPQEWGSGRIVTDCGNRTRLPGGGFGIAEGARKSGWQGTLSDLTDAERERLFDIVIDRGETRPVLLVEDYAPTLGLAERIHYGTFDRLEPDERRDVDLARRPLRIEDWL